MNRRIKETVIKHAFFLFALVSVIVLGLIVLSLFREGLPVFKQVSLKDFVFGMEWYPTYDPPSFGIFPLIFGSFIVTLLATVIAVPLGVLAAIYISDITPRPAVRESLKSVIELLAGLPSVVLGFFGMVIVAPWLQETFDLPTGLNIINASVILAIMAIPTISSISEDALYSVPQEFKEASYALGATKFETITKVILPAALSGISTAVMLGMARAIGETMVVLMVAGGAAAIPESIFDSVRPMPASIAAEMGETPYGSSHYHALFAIGVVLFFLTLSFNLIADYVSHKFRQTGSATL
ncbi:MAG TPA: phosphate ABC transporter permease subunit PstC [Smithellaceae bacterium]|jgi:phosphate transport system permease protein|nr:MAG: Phosphate transport system permease protein PstC [Deltaproteobacteria bacterium ADurb.BinA014]HNQ18065.1 phosphate ABC transporter permease subunit PstC [Smithellaceae bacterium]HNT91251.1 phosphate ABC transporter permease subunit PstC [Smithellaceae bacterium]HNV63981.1 phosphate ABC transporter permease subunit PstC [Smithellaceae bacterium]HNZ32334.1 phosphate ABC transporter permease subunit PstC [Smithellaceae bacterium]